MAIARRTLLAALAATPLLATRSRAMTPARDAALIVVDVQNCFTPGGSLAVPDGDAIVPVINCLA